MREYIVRGGESPALIAARFAGCPKCARDLVAVNPHKKAVVHPNGFATFDELRAGEKLNLPDKWFSKEFDELPPKYFKALPHPDGRTPSVLGALASGVLNDFAALDEAAARVGALAAMNDGEFSLNMLAAADAIDRSIEGTAASVDAGTARAATANARGAKTKLDAAIGAGDQGVAFNTRDAIIHSLSDGLVAARKALNAEHTEIPATTAPPAAHAPPAAVTLASVDPCAPANVAAVCAAQRALGLAVDGKYGDGTAAAVRQTVPGAPPGCNPRPSWWGAAGVSNCPGAATKPPASTTTETLTPPDQKKSLSVASVLGLGALGVGVVGGAIYLTTRAPRRPPPRRPTPRRSVRKKKR